MDMLDHDLPTFDLIMIIIMIMTIKLMLIIITTIIVVFSGGDIGTICRLENRVTVEVAGCLNIGNGGNRVGLRQVMLVLVIVVIVIVEVIVPGAWWMSYSRHRTWWRMIKMLR